MKNTVTRVLARLGRQLRDRAAMYLTVQRPTAGEEAARRSHHRPGIQRCSGGTEIHVVFAMRVFPPIPALRMAR